MKEQLETITNTLDDVLTSIEELEKNHPELYDNPLFASLFDSIVKSYQTASKLVQEMK